MFYVFPSQTSDKRSAITKLCKKTEKKIEKKFDARIVVLHSETGQASAHLKVPHSNWIF